MKYELYVNTEYLDADMGNSLLDKYSVFSSYGSMTYRDAHMWGCGKMLMK